MCRGLDHVDPQAQEALASVLADMAAALCPADPGSVIIGPVDFGEGE